jgi:hypothetical protein
VADESRFIMPIPRNYMCIIVIIITFYSDRCVGVCIHNYYILVETMMIISFVSRSRRRVVLQSALTGCEHRGRANRRRN